MCNLIFDHSLSKKKRKVGLKFDYFIKGNEKTFEQGASVYDNLRGAVAP